MGKPRSAKQRTLGSTIVEGKGSHVSFDDHDESSLESSLISNKKKVPATRSKPKSSKIESIVELEDGDEAPEEVKAVDNPDILLLKHMHENLFQNSNIKKKRKNSKTIPIKDAIVSDELDLSVLAAISDRPSAQVMEDIEPMHTEHIQFNDGITKKKKNTKRKLIDNFDVTVLDEEGGGAGAGLVSTFVMSASAAAFTAEVAARQPRVRYSVFSVQRKKGPAKSFSRR